MPTLEGDPLTKITLNLYTSDVAVLKSVVGEGYTVKIREVIHSYCRTVKQHQKARERFKGCLTRSTN